jgi:hypothetical protein
VVEYLLRDDSAPLPCRRYEEIFAQAGSRQLELLSRYVAPGAVSLERRRGLND